MFDKKYVKILDLTKSGSLKEHFFIFMCFAYKDRYLQDLEIIFFMQRPIYHIYYYPNCQIFFLLIVKNLTVHRQSIFKSSIMPCECNFLEVDVFCLT